MPVFDFSNMQAKKEPVRCTYAMVYSDNDHASPENPILVIDNQKREWKHHSFGIFANPNKQTTFEFEEEDGTISADILKVDARFVSLLKWLGEHHIHIQLKMLKRDMLFTKFRKFLLVEEQSYLQKMDFYSL